MNSFVSPVLLANSSINENISHNCKYALKSLTHRHFLTLVIRGQVVDGYFNFFHTKNEPQLYNCLDKSKIYLFFDLM